MFFSVFQHVEEVRLACCKAGPFRCSVSGNRLPVIMKGFVMLIGKHGVVGLLEAKPWRCELAGEGMEGGGPVSLCLQSLCRTSPEFLDGGKRAGRGME